MTVLLWTVALTVAALTAHTAVNARRLRRPGGGPPPTLEAGVAVLLPLRDEAHRVRPALAALLAQRAVPRLRILVLDDGSTDATADVVREIAGDDPRVEILAGAPLPSGWLGKSHACHQLAAAAKADTDAPAADVLVFLDADVVLAPGAIASSVRLLDGFDLVTPYPRIVTPGAGQRLVQPLLQWSWLTFLPLRAMERSRRPSLAAAGGQFLVVRRDAYDRAGGHAAVRRSVLEDIELARAVKRAGGRIALADGSGIATCQMYGTWRGLVDGYTKSLWASLGPPWAAASVVLALLLLYAVPVLTIPIGLAVGAFGWVGPAAVSYVLSVAGRVTTGRATGGRTWPDALGHPLSIALFAWLVALSYARRRRGELTWKGRRVG